MDGKDYVCGISGCGGMVDGDIHFAVPFKVTGGFTMHGYSCRKCHCIHMSTGKPWVTEDGKHGFYGPDDTSIRWVTIGQ